MTVVALALTAPVLAAGEPDAVAIVLSLRGSAVATVDLSWSGAVSWPEVDQDLREIGRWCGWTLSQPQVRNEGHTTSCQVQITSGGTTPGSLSDVVWPLVGAMARHRQLGVSVIGAPVTTAPLTVENRFVRLEQSGGQGVQWYSVRVKDLSFRTLDELRQPDDTASPARPRHRSFAAAWLLLLLASLAVGVAAYLIARGVQSSRAGLGPHPRRRVARR
jgi:hypothetical protein